MAKTRIAAAIKYQADRRSRNFFFLFFAHWLAAQFDLSSLFDPSADYTSVNLQVDKHADVFQIGIACQCTDNIAANASISAETGIDHSHHQRCLISQARAQSSPY